MFAERRNDEYKGYHELASQNDMDLSYYKPPNNGGIFDKMAV